MKRKIVAVLPAYNARHTLSRFIRSIPRGVFDRIILSDGCSADKTYEHARSISGIDVYQTPHTVGYGGNLKYCLALALKHRADTIVELHPDGEYAVDGIEPALAAVESGADFVLGNRFSDGKPRGMFLTKYAATHVLTRICNAVLGTRIPDMHQGFRVYTRRMLDAIDWRATHDDFLFSFEIIERAVRSGLRIASVPVTAHYRGTKRGATWSHTIRYTFGTLVLLAGFFGAKGREVAPRACPVCRTDMLTRRLYDIGEYAVHECRMCRIAWTDPQPHATGALYPESYFRQKGCIGRVRDAVFTHAQKRRVHALRKYCGGGTVLEVGCGAGRFIEALRNSEFLVTGIDPYASGNDTALTRKRITDMHGKHVFDAVVFWESLEHVPDPVQQITYAHNLLKPGGLLFVEYPRFGSFESKLFGKHWFHLDIPRHTFHFRDQGLRQFIEHCGFTPVSQEQVFAAEYAPAGLLLSTLRSVRLEQYWKWLLPALVCTFPLSALVPVFGQSPIGLLAARKADTIKSRV